MAESFPGATGYLSVMTGFGQALHYTVTRLGEHDRGKCCRNQDYHDREVVLRQSFLCRDILYIVVKKKKSTLGTKGSQKNLRNSK